MLFCMKKFNESVIKIILKNHLLVTKNSNLLKKSDSFIITEFNISNFSRRVDLVYFNKDKSIAFEIKSEFDSLLRLKSQTEEYLKYFDKVVVLAAKKHIGKVKSLVPENVGVWEFDEGKMKIIRRGKLQLISDKMRFIRMMNLNELLVLCKRERIEMGDKKRLTLELNLKSLPIKTLKTEAVKFIQLRYQKRGDNYFDQGKIICIKKNKTKNPLKKTLSNNDISSFIEALSSIKI